LPGFLFSVLHFAHMSALRAYFFAYFWFPVSGGREASA